ncbi:YifB family Mg chelatase-like AAA ATPase [Rathayibacter sp. YIM 133350]|uniref:YifB family Mg chelatase-like AAA ATPase n=1 Tax=Rathayibacter sp. YIM 133350 TaxID=3131992 RepID=UPI00307E4552
MRLGRTRAVALIGMTGAIVDVEADITAQLPKFFLIGLPDTALSQAQHRVRSAAQNAGIPLTTHQITVNLSPAALPKHGSGFDLAIAMACLAAAGDVEPASVERVVHLGELALDGRLRPIEGVLPAVAAAKRAGHGTVMVPTACVPEAELVPDVRVIGVAGLRDAAIWHGGDFPPEPVDPLPAPRRATSRPRHLGDLSDVIGQDAAVLALQVAAAGGHHLFMVGPPGAGKTMLAERLAGILPDLTEDAALEVSAIRSLSGAGFDGRLPRRPPIEAPHHTATPAAMVGGGSGQIRPGAAARAAHGVLFLDEAPQFAAHVLDALRQPLESGVISIHRATAVASFPARFQLVLAANPCPCGLYGVSRESCTCAPMARRRYFSRISGPLLDRIDIQLRVERVSAARLKVAQDEPRAGTVEVRELVTQARQAAGERLGGTRWSTNGEVAGSWLRAASHRPAPAALAALDRALERGALSMRGYDRVLRVAWSVADLAGADSPTADHIGQALFLRRGENA